MLGMLCIVLFLCENVGAEVFVMKDGSTISGDVVDDDDYGVTVKIQYGEIYLYYEDLRKVQDRFFSSKRLSRTVCEINQAEGAHPSAGVIRKELFGEIGTFMYFPQGYNETASFPVVIVIDDEGTGQQYLDRWRDLADEHGYVLLSLFNEGRFWQQDDMDNVSRIIKIQADKHNINGRRMYVIGLSGGGMLGYCVVSNYQRDYRAFVAIDAILDNANPLVKVTHMRYVPTLIVQGNGNKQLPKDVGARTFEMLKAAGCRVTYKNISDIGEDMKAADKVMVFDFFNSH